MRRVGAAAGSTHSRGVALAGPAWRIVLFRVLAALSGLFFLSTLPQALSPWRAVTLSNTNGVQDLDLHRWSAALAGGPDMGLGAVLLYVAWRPASAALPLQWVALAAAVFLAANVPFVGPLVALIAIPVVLVLVAYPEPRALVTAPWAQGLRLPVLAVGVLIAIFLLSDGARALAAQVRGTDELARNYDWASNGEHLINLGLAAVLAGTRKPGANILAMMAAAVLAFLGAAAITVPSNPGSWGIVGGAAAIAAAIVLCAAVIFERRRSGDDV